MSAQLPTSLPLKNTFVHFPQAVNQVNDRLERSTTSPGILQECARVQIYHDPIGNGGCLGDPLQDAPLGRIVNPVCVGQRRTNFATMALRRRCAAPIQPCWAHHLPTYVQKQYWDADRARGSGNASLINSQTAKGPVPASTNIKMDVWNLSNEAEGSRRVQRAFDEAADDAELEDLTNALHGHVWEALASPFANHVLNKSISMAKPAASQYVVDEIMSKRGGAIRASQHKYGCRVVQRALEYCREDQTESLVNEILPNAMDLAQSPYGMHVIRNLLANGGKHRQRPLIDLIIDRCLELSYNTYGRAVLSQALAVADEDDMHALARLVGEPDLLARMAICRCGHYGARSLLESMPEAARKELWDKAVEHAPELTCSTYGQIVAASVLSLPS